MSIVLLGKSQTINGVNYGPWSIITGLDVNKEALLVQGGGAISIGNADLGLLTAAERVAVLAAAGSVGTFATLSALQSAAPAASSVGRTGLVGSAAPYSIYISNGATWQPVDGAGNVVIGIVAPSNSDGRPDNTIYVQVYA